MSAVDALCELRQLRVGSWPSELLLRSSAQSERERRADRGRRSRGTLEAVASIMIHIIHDICLLTQESGVQKVSSIPIPKDTMQPLPPRHCAYVFPSFPTILFTVSACLNRSKVGPLDYSIDIGRTV